jgi:hypothetical protein
MAGGEIVLERANHLIVTLGNYRELLIAGGTVLGVLLLAAFAGYARKKKRAIRPALMTVGVNLALLMNAEGMWDIAVNRMGLPPQFAMLTFAVFEVAMLIMQAKSRERFTSTLKLREDGSVEVPGDSGPFLKWAWVIAITSGVIVATNANSWTERLLRVALPILVQGMWQAINLSEGTRRRYGVFRYSPRRIAERRGWFAKDTTGGADHLDQLERERLLKALVRHGYKIETGKSLERYHLWRIAAAGLRADEALAAEAAKQIRIAKEIFEMVSPEHLAARATEQQRLADTQAAREAKLREAEAAAAQIREQRELEEQRQRHQLTEAQRARLDAEEAHRRQLELADAEARRAAALADAEARRLAAMAEAEELALRRAEAERRTREAIAAEASATAAIRTTQLELEAAAIRVNGGNGTGRVSAPPPPRRESPSRQSPPAAPTRSAERIGVATANDAKLAKIYSVVREVCRSWDDVRSIRNGRPIVVDGKSLSWTQLCEAAGVRRATMAKILDDTANEDLPPWPADPADLSPDPADLSPGSADLSPGSADLSPGSADLSPGSADLSPGSADLSPGSAVGDPRPAPVAA